MVGEKTDEETEMEMMGTATIASVASDTTTCVPVVEIDQCGVVDAFWLDLEMASHIPRYRLCTYAIGYSLLTYHRSITGLNGLLIDDLVDWNEMAH